MKKSISSASCIALFLLTACVTINIYFPAAAAEKVADEIIQEIQDKHESTPTPEADLGDFQRLTLQLFDGILNTLFPPAHAAETNLDIDTPEIRQLRASMKNRYNGLLPFYTRGYIGIQNDGLLSVKNPTGVPLKDRNQVNNLVANENTDRNKLYHAIANANGHPEWFEQIKSTFAQRWISNAGSSWWYQTANGTWKQK